MKKFISWFVLEFLSRVFMEFVWLLFTALMAASIAPMFTQYSGLVLIVVVLFNAAAARVVLYFGLSYLDRQITEVNRANKEAAKNWVRFAITYLKKQPATEPEPPADLPQE